MFYNKAPGGCGAIPSEETKRKMSKSHLGKKFSLKIRQKMSKAASGEKNSQAKRIIINNIEYGCILEGAAVFGVNGRSLANAIARKGLTYSPKNSEVKFNISYEQEVPVVVTTGVANEKIC